MDKLQALITQLEAQHAECSKWAMQMRVGLPAESKEYSGIYMAGQMDGLATAYFLAANKAKELLEGQADGLPKMLERNATNEESGSLALR